MDKHELGKTFVNILAMQEELSHSDVSEDELAHYGVLGMKWGIRRAKLRGKDYTYKSIGQKKYEKKLAKQVKKGAKESKIKETNKKLEVLKARDKNRQDYASKTNLGKSFMKQVLMGPIGSGSYSRFRSADDGRVTAFLKSNIIASSLGLPIVILASRNAEFKQAKAIAKAKEGYYK